METAKSRNFVQEPMASKDVTEVAGVGAKAGKRMTRKGFSKAWMVLGQFLVLKMNEQDFVFWLEREFRMHETNAKQCHQCLRQWCDAFL